MSRLARTTPLLFVFLWSVVAPASTTAQNAAVESPAHISVVDGAALLERDGRSESAPASMPLLAGDRVRTQNGRVEILFNDGSTLHLDSNSTVDFQSDEVSRLLDGRIRLNIVNAGGANRNMAYRVDAPSAWVQIARPGEYRISVLGGGDGRAPEVELAVLRGEADIVNEDGRTTLGAGERAFARAGAGPSPSYVFNSASWDTFDRWSEGRRDSRLGVSAEYLPETVQTYAATFNRLRVLAERADLWLRLVSPRSRRLAALLLRALDEPAAVGMDVDWIGSLGLADASLRTLGLFGELVVLDSGAHVGTGVGVLGLCAGLRELVPARLEQPRCLWLFDRRWISRLQSVERVDGRPASRIRPRLRQRERRQLDAHRCAHAQRVRRPRRRRRM